MFIFSPIYDIIDVGDRYNLLTIIIIKFLLIVHNATRFISNQNSINLNTVHNYLNFTW